VSLVKTSNRPTHVDLAPIGRRRYRGIGANCIPVYSPTPGRGELRGGLETADTPQAPCNTSLISSATRAPPLLPHSLKAL